MESAAQTRRRRVWRAARVVAVTVVVAYGLALAVIWLGLGPRWTRLRPIRPPAPAEEPALRLRVAAYLRAWRRDDIREAGSLTSTSALSKWRGDPRPPAGEVRITGRYWTPSEAVASALVRAISKDDRWDDWRHGRIAFPLYSVGGKSYVLVMVKDDQWMVLSGPSCEAPATHREQ